MDEQVNIEDLRERIRLHVNPNASLTAAKMESALDELEMLREKIKKLESSDPKYMAKLKFE